MKISSLFKESLLVTASRFFTAGLNFIFLSYLARILDKSEFGLFSTWVTALNFMSTFYLLGMNVSYIYFSKDKQQRIVNLVLTIKSLTAIAIIVLSILLLFLNILNVFKSTNHILYYALLAGTYLLSLLNMVNAYYQSSENFNIYSLLTFLPYLISAALVFIAFYFYANQVFLNEAILLYLVGIIVSLFVGVSIFLLNNKVLGLSSFRQFVSKNFLSLEYIKYGIKATSLLLISQVLYASDIFLLKFMKGSEAVSFYFIAVTISKIAWLVTDSVGNVIFPKLTKIGKDKDKIAESDFSLNKIFKFLFLLNLIFIILIVVAGRSIITLFFTATYIESYSYVIVLIAASYGMSVYKIFSRKFAALNQWKHIYMSLIYASTINILLNLILIHYYGALGAAIASLIAYWLCGFYIYRKNKLILA